MEGRDTQSTPLSVPRARSGAGTNNTDQAWSPEAASILIKPTGAICDLARSYCFLLDKVLLYEGDRFQMSETALEEYGRQLIEMHRSSQVTMAWQGRAIGNPSSVGTIPKVFPNTVAVVTSGLPAMANSPRTDLSRHPMASRDSITCAGSQGIVPPCRSTVEPCCRPHGQGTSCVRRHGNPATPGSEAPRSSMQRRSQRPVPVWKRS